MLALLAIPPEGGSPGKPSGQSLQTIDRWAKWWARAINVAGLALASYEIVLRHGGAQSGVLLFCAAMMLGPIGLRILLKGVADLASHAAEED